MPHLRPCSMLGKLYIVPVTIKVVGNRSIYRIGSSSFTTSKRFRLDRSFDAPLLPSVSLYSPLIKFTNNVITTLLYQGKLIIRANNEQFNPQKWYHQPIHFERHVSVLFTRSDDFIQFWWQKGGRKTCQFTTLFWPISRWQTNWQNPGLSVLTSYPCLIFFVVTQFDVWNCFDCEDKIWQQFKSKQFCHEKKFNPVFWFDWKPKLLPFLEIIFFSNWLNLIYSLFWVWG